MAAWTTDGQPLWTEAVEPPWSYEVLGGVVHLDVDGRRRQVTLHP